MTSIAQSRLSYASTAPLALFSFAALAASVVWLPLTLANVALSSLLAAVSFSASRARVIRRSRLLAVPGGEESVPFAVGRFVVAVSTPAFVCFVLVTGPTLFDVLYESVWPILSVAIYLAAFSVYVLFVTNTPANQRAEQ